MCKLSEARGEAEGIPGLIDFKTDSDMIEPKDGKIRVSLSSAVTRRTTSWAIWSICESDRPPDHSLTIS